MKRHGKYVLTAEGLKGLIYSDCVIINEVDKNKHGHRQVSVKCVCGNVFNTVLYRLTSGHTKSCGCLQKLRCAEATTKHSLSTHKLYRVWNSIKWRCNNPNCEAYKNYGARGISMCKEWNDNFIAFYN